MIKTHFSGKKLGIFHYTKSFITWVYMVIPIILISIFDHKMVCKLILVEYYYNFQFHTHDAISILWLKWTHWIEMDTLECKLILLYIITIFSSILYMTLLVFFDWIETHWIEMKTQAWGEQTRLDGTHWIESDTFYSCEHTWLKWIHKIDTATLD